MPLNFTLTYNDGTNDIDDVAGDVGRVGTFGPMWFEPVFSKAGRLVSPDGATCPRQFSGFVDNGVLKTEAGGTTDIRLWANDPEWSIDRFQYRVRADLTDAIGLPIPWDPFYFDAPNDDRVVPLELEIPRPGQKFGRGRPGYGITDPLVINDGGLLVITRENGTVLDPIAIPESSAVAISYALTFGVIR